MYRFRFCPALSPPSSPSSPSPGSLLGLRASSWSDVREIGASFVPSCLLEGPASEELLTMGRRDFLTVLGFLGVLEKEGVREGGAGCVVFTNLSFNKATSPDET